MNNWDTRYLTGVEKIDEQHHRLFAICQRILYILETDTVQKREFVCREGLKFLHSYLVQHLDDEEAYMKQMRYPELDGHRRSHNFFKKFVLPKLEQDVENSGFSQDSVQELLTKGFSWLVDHVATEDMAIFGKHTLPQRVLHPGSDALAAVVEQLFHDVFGGVATKAVDTHYRMGALGPALHYGHFLSLPKEGHVVVVLSVEEELAFSLCSDLLRYQGPQLDRVSCSMVEEFSHLLIQHLEAIFDFQEPTTEKSEFLSAAQRQELEKYTALFSSLFETELGRFSMCVYQHNAPLTTSQDYLTTLQSKLN